MTTHSISHPHHDLLLAIDAPRTRRPGVPMESFPRPVGAAHWKEPEPQPDPGNILKRKSLDQLTPVFGTTLPPKGIAGVMRRVAYKLPEHATSHWFVLLLADRVDVLEHAPLRAASVAIPLFVGGFAIVRFFSKRAR